MDKLKATREKKPLLTGFRIFLLFILVFVIVFYNQFHTAEVRGPSMEPTLASGDKVLVSKAYWLVGDLRIGDIVVIKPQEGETDYYIKRIYATGGGRVDFYNIPDGWSIADGEYVVPPNKYYVLGDNRPVSEDSRTWGPVERERIIGKVIVLKAGLPVNAAPKKN